MSRIAYIISAYKDAPHLARLVDALNDKADFYIHIDQKSDIKPFEEALGDKVTFVPRHWVNWGGWEQVEYQKELLGAVIRSGVAYDRVVCLSGQDYPLWSNEEIHRYFDENKETEFIAAMNLSRSHNPQQRSKIERYHFFRDLQWRNLWLKNKLVVASRWLMRLLPLRKDDILWIGDIEAEIYFGSDYWALTLPCARYVYDTLQKDYNDLAPYFKTSFVPSEMCVQTIVFNSPFKPHAMLYEGEYKGLSSLTPLHYLVYGKAIKTMTQEDWPVLQQSGKMFCRKVVSGASDELVESIDSERKQEATITKNKLREQTIMIEKPEIHIALAADSNYIIPATVVLQSLFDHHHEAEVHIYLLFLESTLHDNDLRFLSRFIYEHKGNFVPLEIKNEQIEGFPETRHGKATLLRLCLPTLLPQLDKILYVDGDIVIKDSLVNLYQTDLSSYYIAAVKDTTRVYHDDYIRALDISDSHWYFNAGVTLMNLKELRSINLPEKVATFAKAHYNIIAAPDQDALNYICQGKTIYVHPRYNMNYGVEKDVAAKVWGKEQVKEAKSSPAIIHFIGPIKPWSILSVHPQRKSWWKVLKKTPFSYFEPKDSCTKNKLRKYYLLITKSIERQFTLESKRKIGALIPTSLKRSIKRSLLKSI